MNIYNTIPSESDFSELINNTTNAWTSNYNGSGVAGYTFTGNGHTLFIPAAGYGNSGSINNVGNNGTTSTTYNGYIYTMAITFTNEYICTDDHAHKYIGHSVRAVKKQSQQ